MLDSRRLLLVVLVLVAALGVLALWTPFGVDQAIFVYGGRTLVSDGDLYRDFWDIKPPGIFVFYGLAGAVAGFDELGIHLLELVWQLLFALLLLRTARLLVRSELAAGVAPILTLAWYWIWGQAPHLTQVEALVGLPIVGCLLSANRISRQPDSRLAKILFGALAGVLMTFKPIYLTFPLAFGLLALLLAAPQGSIRPAQRSSDRWRLTREILVWASVGLLLVWTLLLIGFTVEGSLAEMLHTTFVYPGEAMQEIAAAPLERLRDSAVWCTRVLAPALPLILIGLWTTIRRGRRTLLVEGVSLYFLLGCLAIVTQKTSWWEYHFVLLFPPSSLLASLGVDQILGWEPHLRWRRVVRSGLMAALFALPLIDLAAGVRTRWSELQEARTLDTDAPLPVRLDPGYLKIWNKTRFLRETGTARGSPIYVFGDFRMQWLSGRSQAIAVHGHAWHHLPDGFWQTLPDELMAAKPAYIFVGGFYRKLLIRRAPEFWQHLEGHYRRVRSHGSGHWYKPRRQLPTQKKGQTGG